MSSERKREGWPRRAVPQGVTDPDPQPIRIAHHRDDDAWAQWVAWQLAQVGLATTFCDIATTKDPRQGWHRHLLVLDSAAARSSQHHRSGYGTTDIFWAEHRGRPDPGFLLVRVDDAPLIGFFKHYPMKFQWDVDLVGRGEDQASSELVQTVLANFPERTLARAPAKAAAPKPRYPGMVTVFVSYRRADNADGLVTRLHQAIAGRLPNVRAFLDVVDTGDNDVSVGTRLTRAIGNAPATLIVIGPHWSGSRPVGRGRIQDDGDYVRLEVEYALDQPDGHPVVVLLEGASIPRARDLPEGLGRLWQLRRLPLRAAHLEADIEKIITLVTSLRARPVFIADPVQGFVKHERPGGAYPQLRRRSLGRPDEMTGAGLSRQLAAVLVAVRPRAHPFTAVKALLLTCGAQPDGRSGAPSGQSHNPHVPKWTSAVSQPLHLPRSATITGRSVAVVTGI